MYAMILSDLHGNKEAFLKATAEAQKLKVDIVIVCGDITNFGHVKQANTLFTPLTNLNVPVLYVPGNCDLSSFLEENIQNAQNIHASCTKIKDYTFIGVGCAPTSYLKTPLEFPERWIMDSLNRGIALCSSTKKLIVVSHSPPYNTAVDLAYMNRHIGSHSIRRFVEEKKPVAVFCGHVHEAPGTDWIGETLVTNSGPAKNGSYALAELNESVEVTLGTF